MYVCIYMYVGMEVRTMLSVHEVHAAENPFW